MPFHGFSCEAVVIGAGPYGLSAAAYLRSAGVETCVLGEPMGFWFNQMPKGMLLRSSWESSHLADPGGTLTLDHFERANRVRLSRPIPLDQFIAYGRWFQGKIAPDVVRCPVRIVERHLSGFRVGLMDGTVLLAKRVVVAAGNAPFARRLPELAELPPELASHSCDHRRLDGFCGKRVLVIGCGHGALESAALLREAGAEVEIIARAPSICWLYEKAAWLKSPKNPLRRLFSPPVEVGSPFLNWMVALPHLYRCLPRRLQEHIARRSTRAAGSGWLMLRVGDIPVTVGRRIRSASAVQKRVDVKLDDGSSRRVDHVIGAIGYLVDIRRYPFLSAELLARIAMVEGYPVLKSGFESSVPGLHFLGAPGAYSYGPLCHFVAGTTFMGPELIRMVAGKKVAHSRIVPKTDQWQAGRR